MSYLNQDACAPSESSPPVKAVCKREEGAGNAGRVLKLPLVSKALYLGLSYVRAHIPPLLGEKEALLVPTFPSGKAGQAPPLGDAARQDPAAQGEMLNESQRCRRCIPLPPEPAGFCGSWF